MSQEDNETDVTISPIGNRKSVKVYGVNPFVRAAMIPNKMRRITNKKGDMFVVGRDSGEVISEVAGFWTSKVVDSEKFVKLYVNGVKAFKDLDGSGTRVFEILYLTMQENIGKDHVMLSWHMLDRSVHTMSYATWKRGITQLIHKGFIAATQQPSLYWINPDYCWNGDRMTFIQEVRRKGSAMEQNQQNLWEAGILTQPLLPASGAKPPQS